MPRFAGNFHFRMPRAVDPHRHHAVRDEIERLNRTPLSQTQTVVYSLIAIAVLLGLAAALTRILS